MRLIGTYAGQVMQPVRIDVSLREIRRLRKAVSQYLCHGLASTV